MKSVCGISNPAQSLISSICYPQLHKFTTRATIWGCEHETIARISFLDVAKLLDTNFEYRDSGLVIHRNHPYIGASPDRMLECSCCGYGVLEINVLIVSKSKILIKHLVYKMENFQKSTRITIKFKHNYVYVQQTMLTLF